MASVTCAAGDRSPAAAEASEVIDCFVMVMVMDLRLLLCGFFLVSRVLFCFVSFLCFLFLHHLVGLFRERLQRVLALVLVLIGSCASSHLGGLGGLPLSCWGRSCNPPPRYFAAVVVL